MLLPRVKYQIERLALKTECIDIVRIRRERGDLACICYYSIMLIAALVFAYSLYGLQQPESDIYTANNTRLEAVSKAFQSKAGVFTLDLRGKLNPETNESESAIVSFSLVENSGGSQTEGKGELFRKHSFESSFFLLKQSEDLKKALADLKLNEMDAFSQKEKPLNKKLIITKKKCMTLQFKHAGSKESWRNMTQELCEKSEIYSKQKTARGIRFNLYKLEPEIFRSTHCRNGHSCELFCQEQEMLYSESNFINDKLKGNITTCYKPFVAKEICAVIEKSANKEEYSFVEGCYNGEVEQYKRLELNTPWFFHNMTNFILRDKSDPFLLAIALSGDPENPWEIGMKENRASLKYALAISGALLMSVMVLTAYLVYKRKHIKMLNYDADEGFNELESSTIKL